MVLEHSRAMARCVGGAPAATSRRSDLVWRFERPGVPELEHAVLTVDRLVGER